MFAETMLGIRQDVVVGEMLHHSTVYYMLTEFAEDRRKGYWPVVGSFRSASFLEKWNYVGFLPL